LKMAMYKYATIAGIKPQILEVTIKEFV